jgi:hypothetical protein
MEFTVLKGSSEYFTLEYNISDIKSLLMYKTDNNSVIYCTILILLKEYAKY